jgi:pentose-5-phosphate-3-epimerase
MNEIIPALIPQNLNIVREQFGKVLGLAKKVQIDLVDGEYAPVKTWPFNKDQAEEMLHFVREEDRFPYVNDFVLEFDLLLLHPIEYLSDLISLGAKSFVVHIDSTDHLKECIETIHNTSNQIGLGIKPSLDSALLEPFLTQIDFVQFMGNDRVGYNGVTLDEKVLEKIKSFHQQHPSIPIQVDIGVNSETIPKLKTVGVSRFISNSSIFNTPDPRATLQKLQSL